jgi:hypothetical protein
MKKLIAMVPMEGLNQEEILAAAVKAFQEAGFLLDEVVNVGDMIYIDTSLYISHGVDDVIGGLVKVIGVEGAPDDLWVIVDLEPDTKYRWNHLRPLQEKLASEFGNNRAYKKPDFRPENNEY